MSLDSQKRWINRKQIEDLLWTPTRTRGGGRQKIQEEEDGRSGLSSQLD